MFAFTNICDFGKMFMVNHKHVCVFVRRTSQPYQTEHKLFKLFNLLKSHL